MEELLNGETGGQPPRGRSRRKGNKWAAEQASHRKKSLFSRSSQSDSGTTEKAQNPQNQERRRKILVIAAAAAGVVLIGAGTTYIVIGQKYKSVYYPNTIVNGIDVSGRTPEQAKEMIAAGIRSYMLTLDTRSGEESIAGSSIDLHPEYDGSLEYILDSQSPYLWGGSLTKEVSYTISTMTVYDQEKLQEAVNGLSCMDPDQMEAPQDAALSDYIEGVGYQIIPETQGNLLESGKVLQAVEDAIANLQPRISLEELDLYEKPRITSEDEALNERLAALNQYVQMTVTYVFGSQKEILDGAVIHQWLSLDEQGQVQVDEAQITEYVQQLGKKYNTAYQPKKLKTSYGETVTITGGNYGWRINQKEEAAALAEIIRSGQSQEREPVYLQKAASHEGADYGSTYVEINLTAQHLYFYKDGKLVVESDFVSGNEARGFSTPAGAYPLTYKQRNATLKGEGYSTPVSYWMPFNGGIGMHDASWRSSFGGKIYKTNGSHGCINLPASVAKTIYENIDAGMPVLCYHLDGTGSKTTTSGSGAEKPAQQETAAVSETSAAAGNPSVPETSASVPETAPSAVNPSQGTAAAPENPAGGQSSPAQPGQTSGTETAGAGQGGSGTAAQPGTSSGGPGTQQTPQTSGTGVQQTPQNSGTGVQQTPQGSASAGPGAAAGSSGVSTQETPGGQAQISPGTQTGVQVSPGGQTTSGGGVQASPTPGGGSSYGPGGQAAQPGPGTAVGPGA